MLKIHLGTTSISPQTTNYNIYINHTKKKFKIELWIEKGPIFLLGFLSSE